jgi:membrane protein required for colicin V production
MNTTDIFLLVIIVASLLVGFFWGAARSLLLLAAWLVAFIFGAYLQLQVGAWLTRQWTNFDPGFNQAAAFGIIFLGILLLAPIVIVIGTDGDARLSRSQVLDDAVGAVFAAFVAVLGIAAVMIILSTYYADREVNQISAPDWVTNLYLSLEASGTGRAINERLIPLIAAVMGPLLPPHVREAMT